MKKHGFELSELKDLPNAVANPIAIFNNYQKEGNRSILTELKTKQGNFLVTLDIGKDSDIDFNIVSSVFGKSGNKIIDWINKGYATFINKEKALNYLHNSTPIVEVQDSQELSSATKIVERFQNPKLEGKDDIRFHDNNDLDREYLDAVNRGDMETAQRMVNEAAAKAGFDANSDYQGTSAFNGAAPSNDWYYNTKDERIEAIKADEIEGSVTLGDIIDVPNGFIIGGLEDFASLQIRRGSSLSKASARNILDTIRSGKRTITMYRSVPADVQEDSFRNGDWITPSREYAIDNAEIHGFESYRVIEQEVDIDNVWWDGNDINEWGYDDSKSYGYKNTKNNAKMLDAITYDDSGNIIPLSKRFNQKISDTRYRYIGEQSDTDAINDTFNEQLQQQIDGTLPKGHVYELGMPSEVLLSTGIPNISIKLQSSVLNEKSNDPAHPYQLSEIKDLVKQIQEPIAIFEYGDKSKAQNLMIGISQKGDEGKQFLVGLSITPTVKGITLEINSIRNVFPKNYHDWIHWINQGKMLRVDGKAEIQAIIDALRINPVDYINKNDLDSATKIINDFKNPKLIDNQSGYYRKNGNSQTNIATTEQKGQQAQALVDKLKLSNVVINTEVGEQQGKKAGAKGYYDPATGKIVINVYNHSSIADIEATILHEAVAHHGLRELFGNDFDNFLDSVFYNAEVNIRKKISALAAKHSWDFRKATEEYLASLAETTSFEQIGKTSIWQQVKQFFKDMLRKLGFSVNLSDNELRYVLWRSYSNLTKTRDDNIFSLASDIAKQYELGVGEYAYRDAKVSQRRKEMLETNRNVDLANAFVTGKSEAEARKGRQAWLQEHKDLAKDIYGRVLKGEFNDVTLGLIDKYIDEFTPNNPYGRHISQRLPQKVERRLRSVNRTNAVDALFSRIAEGAVKSSRSPLAQRTREITEVKSRMLKEWAKATGNWHTSIADFTNDSEPIGSGKDSDVYYSKDKKNVIKVSKGKIEGRKYVTDIDAVALYNSVFPSTRYDILGYGEIDGHFVKFLSQPIILHDNSNPVSEDERIAFMDALGFKPRKEGNTVFSNGEIVVADVQQSNIVRDYEGKIHVIDADVKLHTKDIGGKYTYPTAKAEFGLEEYAYRNGGESAIDKINATFNEQLQQQIEGTLPKGHVYQLGMPSTVLRSAGVANLPIELSSKRLQDKSEQDNHPFSISNLKDLPNALNNPIAIFDSRTKEGSKVILTELKQDDSNFVVVLRVRRGQNGLEVDVNDIRSLYPKDRVGGIAQWITSGLLRYADKKKLTDLITQSTNLIGGDNVGKSSIQPNGSIEIQALMDQQRTNLADVEYLDLGSIAKVVENFENPILTEDFVYRIDEVNTTFNEQLQQQIEGTLPKGHVYQLGMPSGVLRGAGLPNLPIELAASRLVDKSMQENHPFDLSEAENLPQAIHNPLAVFRSATHLGSFVVLTELKHEKQNYVAAIRINKNANRIQVNQIRSLHYRNGMNIVNWLNEGLAEYIKPTFESEWLTPLKNELRSKPQYHSAEVRTELTSVANVVKNFVNPTLTEDFDNTLLREADENHEGYAKTLARDRYEKRMRNGMYQSIEALQDSMRSLLEAMKLISKDKKFRIEDVAGFENAYLGENRLTSTSKAEADAFANLLFKPMLNEVANLAHDSEERETLTNYMIAKHGLERNLYMATRDAKKAFENNQREHPDSLKTLQDFIDKFRKSDYAGLTALTGMKKTADAETKAEAMVKEYELTHDTEKLWNRVNAVSDAILSKSYECGMMNKETYDSIKNMYEHYIPLRGFDETTSGDVYAYLSQSQSAFNAPVKKARGRNSKADDPFANLQAMAESAITQGNRNVLVKQKFLNFVLNHPSDLVSVSELWLKYDNVNDEWRAVFPETIEASDTPAVVERKMREFEEKMKELADKEPGIYKHGKDTINIPYRIVGSRDLHQHQVIVKRGGKDIVLTVNGNPRLAQALNGQTNPDNDLTGAIGVILRGAESVNRQLSAFYTTRNPDFVVSNFVRDMLYSNSMVWVKEKPNYALRFHKNFTMNNPAVMKTLFAKQRKGELDMSKPLEKSFHQFIMNGGETGYTNLKDIEKRKNDITRALKKMNGNSTK